MRFIWAAFSWLAFQFLIFIPLVLIGWIIVPIAAICRAYKVTDFNESKPADGPILHFTWPFMHVWDNYEDGIANRNYRQFKTTFMQIVYWSCLRNPVNNLRTVKYLSFDIDTSKVNFIGSFSSLEKGHRFPVSQEVFHILTMKYFTNVPQWFFCWHGLYSCFYWQGKSREFLVGWKVYPKDIFGINSYRRNGTGFGLQFKKIKK
jgi:hypothetical protein